MLRRLVRRVLPLLVIAAGTVSAQNYPHKPIRVLTGDAGGPADFAMRLAGPGLASNLGQPVIVDNRPWAVAVETAAKAPPDGYTLLIYASIIWLAPLMRDNLPWDAVRDFAPVTLAGSAPNILVVHPSLPVQSVRDLIALAKAKPGELNCGSGPTGSTTHLAMEVFRSMAGVNLVRVPYKGNVPALSALVGGQLQMFFANVTSALPHVKSGRLKALAVTSAAPSALAPGLPTMAASGLPGYEVVSIIGLFAPSRTPAALITRLNQEIVRVLGKPDVKEKLFNTGIEVIASSPMQLAATMKSEIVRLGKIIRDAGIREE